MELGLFNLMTLRDNPAGAHGVMQNTTEMVRLAESIGFDVAWFAEHHFTNYSISVSPLMMAAYMAGRTSQIRLGAAVLVLPLYHPLRVAQELALLDLQSDGRAVIGVGSGYQPYEFLRYGVRVQDKSEIFLEYWTVMEQLLRDGHVGFSGRYVEVPPTDVTIRPLQRPMRRCSSPRRTRPS